MQVLVVEDEARLAETLAQLLREQNYRVDVVYNGGDGLAYAESGQYDVIVLDVMLPGIDGYEVARTLRRKKNGTPILMLTARSEVTDKVAGLDCGADDYMTKPFAPEELLARVRALTRRQGVRPRRGHPQGSTHQPGVGAGVGGGGQQRGGIHLLFAQKAALFRLCCRHQHPAKSGVPSGSREQEITDQRRPATTGGADVFSQVTPAESGG